MAYQTRGRDPLFDPETQAVLQRRGTELLGLVMLAAGIACAAMLGTFAADDPSWLTATSEPARNALGRFGASLASPLYVIVGMGAWGFAAVLTVWGVRLVVHAGDARLGRIVFAPIAIALASVYAATHVPPGGWAQTFNLGGLFGDTVLGTALGLLPVAPGTGLRIVSFASAVAGVAAAFYALGVNRREMRGTLRWLWYGAVVSYVAVVRGIVHGLAGAGRSASAGLAAARNARAKGGVRTAPDDVIAPAARRRRTPGAEDDADDPRRGQQDAGIDPEVGGAPAGASLVGRALAALRRSSRTDAPDAGTSVATEAGAHVGSGRMRAEPALGVPVVRGAAAPFAPPVTAASDDDIADREMPAPELVDPELSAAPLPPAFATRRGDHAPLVRHPTRKPVTPSSQARAEAQPALRFDEDATAYEPPPLSLLASPDTVTRHHLSDEALKENARMLEAVLDDYGVKGEIVSVRPGPVVTMYELEPAPGLKASRVIGLSDDIARSMSALSARVSTVPGRSVIGIELPNENREMCVLREILSARDFGDTARGLPLALGKDIGGDPVIANLAKMPHLLIAGTTGSGKSVAINTMILSLLYKLTPAECRLIMIDPKMLELSVYDGIPHLLSPVVTDPKKAVVALKWVVGEMEERYRKMSKMGVRNIEGFNGRVREALGKGELFSRTVQTGFDAETGEPTFETEETVPEAMPFIVVVVDEMADLMMVAGKEIEACIQRLAQMARASGIHLIMATQRPSVDVITGTIKANFPTRISFQVTSKIDSRTILGEQGAEQLLGMGDMLYMAGGSKITRVHGPFCSDEEVEEIVTYLKGFGPPEYLSGVIEGPDEERGGDIDAVLGLGGGGSGDDLENALYDTAVAIAIKDRKCSTSYIQRKLAIGYNKAARLVEQMEDEGVVSPANHVGKREVLVPEQG